MLLKKQEPPAKIEVTDFDLPYYGDDTKAAWWSEEPVWGEVTHAHSSDGGWENSRTTTNTPMVRVWVDVAIGGNDCRWASMQMQQTQAARGSSDSRITTSETFINREFVDQQRTWPCAKIRALIANDPNYKTVMPKE